MKPKIAIILTCSLLLTSGTLCAQKKKDSRRFNPDRSYEELTLGGGVMIPLKGVAESSAMAFADYAAFGFGGFGFRGGVRYAYSNNDVLTHFELPLRVAWRSKLRVNDRRDEALADVLIPETYMTYTPARGVEYRREDRGSSLMNFLLCIIPYRIELNAGIAPGYIFGGDVLHESTVYGVNGPEDHKYTVHKKFGFSASVEAGVKLSYRIWRFELSFNPAVHYSLTDNFDFHASSMNDKPSRLFVSLGGGLGFMF